MKHIQNLRRDPVSPCKDFWHALRIGLCAAAIVFLVTWGVSAWLLH